MRKVGIAVACVALACAATAVLAGAPARASDYWLLDDFNREFPAEADKARSFSQVVDRPTVPYSGDRQEPVRVTFLYPGIQVSDYWRRSIASFRGRMDEIGLPLTIDEHFTRPGTELALQHQLLRDLQTKNPDYLVFTLDASRHADMVERIMVEGGTKVILQNITTPLRAFRRQQPFMYVGFDHAEGTQLLAGRFIELFPAGGRFAILYGTQGYVSRLRGGTFLDRVGMWPGMNLVASYYVDFNRERAFNAASELLSEQPDLDFIYAVSTDIAHGVVDALKEAGRLGSVTVNGWGGGGSELAAIQAGELDFTVMRMNDDNGVAMAEAIRLDVTGRGDAVPLVFAGQMVMVGQATSAPRMRSLQDHAFRYSGQ